MQGKKRPKPLICNKIVMDTGPLLVLLFGCSSGFGCDSTRRACSTPKDRKFYEEHGDELLKILARKQIFITPHVIAELSSHIESNDTLVPQILNHNNALVNQLLTRGTEHYISLKEILTHQYYVKNGNFGITDCGLLAISDATTLLLTQDGDLKKWAISEGFSAMFPQDIYYSITDTSLH
jgi:hypothetical protein